MTGCEGCGMSGLAGGIGGAGGCGCGGSCGCGCGGSCGGSCGGACGGPDTSGCCRGIATSTPQPVWNRPGLSRVSWRAGTHPQFFASMVAGLSRADRPALAGLRTRDGDDLSLALFDGWAAVADVVTFYTERIAQEGFLRTATERRSLVDLAALVGHQPRPGLGASVHLAYTVSPDGPVVIPPGSRAQSVPDPGDLPATFETADPLLARHDVNLMSVRRSRPQVLTPATFGSRDHLLVRGPQSQVLVGDALLVHFPRADAWSLLEVYSVTVREDRTALGLVRRHSDGIGDAVVDLRRRRPGKDQSEDGEQTTRLGNLVKALRVPPSVPPPSERELGRDLGRLLAGGSDGVVRLLGLAVPEVARSLAPALSETRADDQDPAEVLRWTARTHLFGHRAPQLAKYRAGAVVGFTDPLITPIPVDGPPIIIAAAIPPTIDPPIYHPSNLVHLDEITDVVVRGSHVAFVNESLDPPVEFRTVTDVTTVSVSALATSGRVTRLALNRAWPSAPGDGTELSLADVLRRTTVLAAPAVLEVADEPIDDEDVEGDEIELDGVFRDLEPGRWVVVAGERSDASIRAVQGPAPGAPPPPLVEGERAGTGVPAAELSMIAAVEHRQVLVPPVEAEDPALPLPGDPVHTFVRLADPLAYTYLRPSVRVYGNVVRATHGETGEEVLGSGDATKAWASYPLKKPPLTHLPAADADGSASTLEVYVDGLRWREVPDLATAGPDDRCYTVVRKDGGGGDVVFGDGVHGLRPPTGSENIVARYRSGQGRYGNLLEHRITVATDRPLGVRDVTNPIEATGGADPDSDEALRERTPLGVRALDRLVSVSDYGDLATAFAGVGSAVADEITDGRRRLVHVTVAGIDDEPIGPASDLLRSLRRALRELGDPHVEVRVAVRRLSLVVAQAGVRISPDRRWSDVEPALRAAMVLRHGPAARRVGESLAASSVLATMAAVRGVEHVDLDVLDTVDELVLVSADPTAQLGLRSWLRAGRAGTDRSESGGIRPAGLVRLAPEAPETLVLSQLVEGP